MAKPASRDTRYLEIKNGKYRVTKAVPRDLQNKLGTTRLKRSLETDSLSLANRLKGQALSELQAIIDHAREGTPKDAITREAREVAGYRSRANGSTETEESGVSRAFCRDKLSHHKKVAGGSGRYSGIEMSESIH